MQFPSSDNRRCDIMQSLDDLKLPLAFEGFYSDPQTGKGYGEMDHCSPRTIIYLYK